MKKTLYSLILNDDVVREIDNLAHRRGSNRSSLINQILADYVSIITPERRIGDIFRAVEAMLAQNRELVTFFEPNALSMSLKSSLQYKYRPTVKYEVSLFRSGGEELGELSVIFRTQSEALISEMTEFFRLIKQIEDDYRIRRRKIEPAEYALYEGKFVRSISVSANRDYGSAEIAAAISDYVSLFDELLKDYLCGRRSARAVESAYISHMEDVPMLI